VELTGLDVKAAAEAFAREILDIGALVL